MGQQHDFRFRMLLEHACQVVGFDGLAPFGLETRDISPVGGREGCESLAEVAAQGDDHLITGRNEVRDRGLQASSPGRGQQEEVVGSLEDSLRARGDLGKNRCELRAAVIDHRPVHAAHDALGQRSWSGNTQLGLEGHEARSITGLRRQHDSKGRSVLTAPQV